MRKSSLYVLMSVVLLIILSACNQPPPDKYVQCGYANKSSAMRCACSGELSDNCPSANCAKTDYFCNGECTECKCFSENDDGDLYISGQFYAPSECSNESI